MSVVPRILAVVGERQARRWDRLGPPGPVWRWCLYHPWLVTIGVGTVLAVVLGAVFGVPPFSPLLLVLIVVAPIQPVLQAQRRVHDRWVAAAGRDVVGSPSPSQRSEPTDREAPGDRENHRRENHGRENHGRENHGRENRGHENRTGQGDREPGGRSVPARRDERTDAPAEPSADETG